MVNKTQIELNIVLPEISVDDECVKILTERLSWLKGIEKAHVISQDYEAQLCLHFDPNLISLGEVKRIARTSGASITERYRHEQIAFKGLNTADSAQSLQKSLTKQDGVVHASVNYAAGLIFIAYDTEVIQRPAIEAIIQNHSARIIQDSQQKTDRPEEHEHAGHNHGSAPEFLPHWLQEKWTLFLVGLAGIFFAIGFVGETFLGMNETVAMAFYILAYIAGGYDIATHAIPGLLRGEFDTDVLMLAAAGGAAILGEWAEGAFLLFLFSLGHAGEHYALDRARDAVNKLGELMPVTAQLKTGEGVVDTPVEELNIDDVVLVRPGDRVPVDGEVVAGNSNIDQSPITGESMPVTKNVGDEVFAGTINQENSLDVKVTKLAKDNTLSRVMQMVAEAQSQQSPTQRFTQRFTAWFVPAVLIGTLLFVIIPPLMGLTSLQDSFYRGMLLLVAASPCALAVGTPAAVLSGIAQAARNGVLIKGGVHLESLGTLDAIAFDKTGTITTGEFGVSDFVTANGTSEMELLRIVASVEQQSNHPLAKAIVAEARKRDLNLENADGLENIAGKGVRSAIDGTPVLLGSGKLFVDNADFQSGLAQQVETLEHKGRTAVIVQHGERFLGVLGLADVPRENAQSVMQSLQAIGVKHLVMLTGDNDDVAQQIAQQVGLTDVKAELLPEDKLQAIKSMEKSYDSIAMVGDGVNDAPALATATVGIAMGGAGTAVALETADVALMADDLSKLPFAVGLSRASRRIIQQNLAISLGVIGLLILASVLGVVQLSGAVILHEGSTILVVGNAIRLLAYKE